MGRSRRRNRHGPEISPEQHAEVIIDAHQPEALTLAPTYVPVAPSPWSAESDTPVLPLEGLQPWEEIRGPSIATDDEPSSSSPLTGDSGDPTQLELTPAEIEAGIVAALEPVVDPVELRFQQARAASDDGRAAEARLIYREIIAQQPSHLSSRNNLALLLEKNGDTQGALVEYDRALELDADHATLLTNRGALLGAMGRYAAAERDLKKVLRADANHVEALFNLGVVMTRKGLWGEAVAQLRRVVEIDPARGLAYFHLGEALNKVDDLYGAMAAYQRAAELLPDHPRALYGLGIVYDRLGRPDDAARMYRRSRETGRR